jgi:hypothetical protein
MIFFKNILYILPSTVHFFPHFFIRFLLVLLDPCVFFLLVVLVILSRLIGGVVTAMSTVVAPFILAAMASGAIRCDNCGDWLCPQSFAVSYDSRGRLFICTECFTGCEDSDEDES